MAGRSVRNGTLTSLCDVLDHGDELCGLVALLASEGHELSHFAHHGASLWSPGDGDATASPELEQPLVPQLAQGPEHRVLVDAEHGREVLRQRHPLSRSRLAIGDRSPQFGGHLLIQRGLRCQINLHGAIKSRSIRLGWEDATATFPEAKATLTEAGAPPPAPPRPARRRPARPAWPGPNRPRPPGWPLPPLPPH